MARRIALMALIVCFVWTGSMAGVLAAASPAVPPDTVAIELGPGQKRYPYFNPVYPADAPDPALLRVGEYFYAAATGERLLRSKDLVQWEYVGRFFTRYPAWVDPVSPDFWAPDLQFIDGKYLLYFSARERGHQTVHRGIGVAWADRPEGPYTPVDEPLISGPGYRHIDQYLFQDDDGTWYMYWGSDHHPILVQEMAPDGLSLVGEATVALEPLPFMRYSRLVEGPWVIKRGGYYYMFWSGDNFIPGEYAMSVARARSPLGPFVRFVDNPILIGDLTWASPGHNAIIQDDAGQDWVLYHAYDWTDTGIGRMLLLDPLVWRNGWPRIKGRVPTTGPIEEGPIWESDAIPLVEVAGNRPVEASSSRRLHWAELAVDRETKTSWLPEPDDPDPWIVVDLGEAMRIARGDLRFGQGRDRRYRIDVSLDGNEWELVVDRRRTPAQLPVEEIEATARYVRVSLPGPLRSEQNALREVRLFAYQNVWIESPALVKTPSPFEIRAHVSPDLAPKRVSLSLDGETLYAADVPFAAPIVSPYLADGSHVLTLEVVDANDAVWRHDVRLTVANAMILEPEHGANLRGESLFRFRTGSGPIEEAMVTLAPIRNGEVFVEEAITLYHEGLAPEALVVDTEAYPDGTYQLTFEVKGDGGISSQSGIPVIIKNWERLADPFELPQTSGWFGVIERKQTIEESDGWAYDDSDPAAFHGDRDRRIWTGQGVGHLIWETPGLLHRFRVTLYVRGADLDELQVSSSLDQAEWKQATWEIASWQASDPRPGESPSDDVSWSKVELAGVIEDDGRFFRFSLPSELGSESVQVGHVELVYREE